MTAKLFRESASIQKAVKKDLREISIIFKKESAKKPYSQKWDQKTALKKILEYSKRGKIYAVRIKDEVAGFVIITFNVWENGKSAFIDELWLRPVYQKKGMGSVIMNFVEGECRRKKVNSVFLITNKAGAFEFYKKLNYLHLENFVLMRKRLETKVSQ